MQIRQSLGVCVCLSFLSTSCEFDALGRVRGEEPVASSPPSARNLQQRLAAQPRSLQPCRSEAFTPATCRLAACSTTLTIPPPPHHPHTPPHVLPLSLPPPRSSGIGGISQRPTHFQVQYVFFLRRHRCHVQITHTCCQTLAIPREVCCMRVPHEIAMTREPFVNIRCACKFVMVYHSEPT